MRKRRSVSHKTLPPQILECPLAHYVSLDVFALHVMVWPECLIFCILFQLLVQRDRILNFRNFLEMSCVWDFEAPHAECVSPLLEMTFESTPAPVGIVTANLALILDAEAVEPVEPERDGFAVPAQRQVQWVINRAFLFVSEVRPAVDPAVVILRVIAVVPM